MKLKNAIAICGIGTIGLITEDYPQKITYPDGNQSMAYIGMHLTNKICPVGSPWASRKPIVIGYLDYDNIDKLIELLQ